MRLTDALLGEHGVFYSIFDQIEIALEQANSDGEGRALMAGVGAAIASHAQIENDLLLNEMEKRMGPGGPVAVMRDEHERIEAGLQAIAGEQNLEQIRATATELFGLARQHFAKEEQVLFRIAHQQLGDEFLEAKALEWAERRRVSVG